MKEELLQELKAAMREKDELRKNTITMLRSAILQVEKDTQKALSEEEMKAIVAKEVKKRKESIVDFEKADRQDIVEGLQQEIAILSKYLPEQLNEEQVEQLVKEAIVAVGATTPREMGKVMQALRPKIQGKADGKMVSDMVKKRLAE